MKVVLTDQARSNLHDIALFIAKDNPKRARSFAIELRDKAKSIGDSPFGFPIIPRYEKQNVRKRPYKNYILFYIIEYETVYILHILHSAQDYEAVLFSTIPD